MNIARHIYTFIIIAVAFCGATAIVSCDSQTVYHKYSHTLLAGWEKNDTLIYYVQPVKEPGRYNEEIGLRINDSYPFMSITLVVKQQIFPGKRTKTDTLKCNLTDTKGYTKGHGISYYQFNFPLKQIDLRRGDSIQVSIQHAMKREILPGVSDVGFKITE